jgi:hypothetical protein
LLEVYYADAIPADLFKSEQDRIARESAIAQEALAFTAEHLAEAAKAVDIALDLARRCHDLYLT